LPSSAVLAVLIRFVLPIGWQTVNVWAIRNITGRIGRNSLVLQPLLLRIFVGGDILTTRNPRIGSLRPACFTLGFDVPLDRSIYLVDGCDAWLLGLLGSERTLPFVFCLIVLELFSSRFMAL
jgi:hypothetical protein